MFLSRASRMRNQWYRGDSKSSNEKNQVDEREKNGYGSEEALQKHKYQIRFLDVLDFIHCLIDYYLNAFHNERNLTLKGGLSSGGQTMQHH